MFSDELTEDADDIDCTEAEQTLMRAMEGNAPPPTKHITNSNPPRKICLWDLATRMNTLL